MISTLTDITVDHYLVLSAILFFMGLAGLVCKKNLLAILMCLEVMLNAVNLAFIAPARYHAQMDGHVIALFVMAVAAVEAAIGLGIVIVVFRGRQTVDASELNTMKG